MYKTSLHSSIQLSPVARRKLTRRPMPCFERWIQFNFHARHWSPMKHQQSPSLHVRCSTLVQRAVRACAGAMTVPNGATWGKFPKLHFGTHPSFGRKNWKGCSFLLPLTSPLSPFEAVRVNKIRIDCASTTASFNSDLRRWHVLVTCTRVTFTGKPCQRSVYDGLYRATFLSVSSPIDNNIACNAHFGR